MVDEDDWRLQGQERYLKGVELLRRTYRRYPKNPGWDHDHCSFCRAEFAVEDRPDVMHEGYCTLDEYRWICGPCFADFQALFEWRVVPEPQSDP